MICVNTRYFVILSPYTLLYDIIKAHCVSRTGLFELIYWRRLQITVNQKFKSEKVSGKTKWKKNEDKLKMLLVKNPKTNKQT